MAPIDVIAILNPKPGKADKLQKLLSIAAESVRANEPGVLRYHIQRQINEKKEPLFVVEETYKDQEALEAHAKREFFRDFGKILKKEDLLSEPTKIIFVKEVGGYKSKL